jgi:hypothetical protein
MREWSVILTPAPGFNIKRFQMSQPSDEREPRYVICHCRHCDGHIEFDANELEAENSTVSCPFCGSETQLQIPSGEKGTPPATTREPLPPDKFKSVKVTRGKRVSLTPSQCGSGRGQELLVLLSEITREGLVSKDGVERLNAWLDENTGSEIPAISFLANIPERFGELTTAKAFQVHFAIERVLPKTFREGVREKRQEAWLHSPLKPRATEAQLNYIRDLGGKPPVGINIAEASLLIEQLLDHSDHSRPTPRQIMVLRFWNRMDLANRSRSDISNWLEHFYAQDSRRKSAWQLYKLQNKDDGTQRDPSWVKIGEGENCLRELIAWRKKAGLILLGVVMLIIAVVVFIACFSGRM